MMKKTITLFLAAIAAILNVATAKHVGMPDAAKAGINFYAERCGDHRKVQYQDLKVRESWPVVYNGNTVYYVFNLEGTGFVIVSADDAVMPVLAYSFDGTVTKENQPPQFLNWMDGYAKQIDDGIRHPYAVAEATSADWKRLLSNDPGQLTPLKTTLDVSPLLISTWDQGGPYNFLCPSDPGGPGGHVWAGCVATAMSQVMYYYRYPLTGLGSHCYTPWGYPQQCADFGNTTYNWNEMLTSLSGKDSSVATLIWHAGISVDMMYSPNGSGAYSEDARNALVNNFRYGSEAQLLQKDNYSETQWESMMRDNLDHKRPMYYDGYGTGGHAFNLDGYQGTNYFHFNWGWSGSFNGYYYLTNLNPGGDNFTNGQGAIVDLYPDSTLYTYPYYCQGETTLTALAGTFEDGSGPRDYHNNMDCQWLIHPHSVSDSIVSITITFNRFETESGSDILTIYNGATTSDPIAGQFSGSGIPPSFTIQGSQALVAFVTNGSVTKSGWFISYRSESLDWCQSMASYTDNSGEIGDGSMNYNYKNGTVCRWEIIPSSSSDPVTLYFTSFKTEPVNDIVRIYDYESQQILAEYSGDYSNNDLPDPVTAPSGKMFVMFVTNGSISDEGWSAFYANDPAGIGNTASLPEVTLYPNPASDIVTLRTAAKQAQQARIEILTIDGKTISSQSIRLKAGISENPVDISGIPSGIYLVRMIGANDVVTRKLMVN
jgi:hypothetical protein